MFRHPASGLLTALILLTHSIFVIHAFIQDIWSGLITLLVPVFSELVWAWLLWNEFQLLSYIAIGHVLLALMLVSTFLGSDSQASEL